MPESLNKAIINYLSMANGDSDCILPPYTVRNPAIIGADYGNAVVIAPLITS